MLLCLGNKWYRKGSEKRFEEGLGAERVWGKEGGKGPSLPSQDGGGGGAALGIKPQEAILS